MAEPPSTERKRVGSDSPETPDPAPIRSKIWKPFGDIILQAESTQFRINRDILAAQSCVFKDMFSMPQPPNEPTIEGCQIVHVSDTAKDWELLLEVLYNPFQSTVSRPLAVVAATLRLGKKYEMQEPKEDALRRIHYQFPGSWEDFDAGVHHWSMINYEDGAPMRLLNLVHECAVYSAIPTLILDCLGNYSLKTLAAVVQRETAKKPWPGFSSETPLYPHKSCKSREACVTKRMAVALEMISPGPGPNTEFRVCYVIDPWPVDWAHRLCSVCEETAKNRYEMCRRKGWELLPTFFGLPRWEDLKDTV